MNGRRTASEIREPPRAPSYTLIDLAAYLRPPVALGRTNLGPEDPEWLGTVHGGCYVGVADSRHLRERGWFPPPSEDFGTNLVATASSRHVTIHRPYRRTLAAVTVIAQLFDGWQRNGTRWSATIVYTGRVHARGGDASFREKTRGRISTGCKERERRRRTRARARAHVPTRVYLCAREERMRAHASAARSVIAVCAPLLYFDSLLRLDIAQVSLLFLSFSRSVAITSSRTCCITVQCVRARGRTRNMCTWQFCVIRTRERCNIGAQLKIEMSETLPFSRFFRNSFSLFKLKLSLDIRGRNNKCGEHNWKKQIGSCNMT